MKKHRDFDIPFLGLEQGEHFFEYKIDKTFFEGFDYKEFTDVCVAVKTVMLKFASFLELDFTCEGWVYLPCDISQEMFRLPINGNLKLLVKFGKEYNNNHEEILILPYGEYQVNVAQYIYEMIVLSVPIKRVHPEVVNGTLNSEVMNKLEQLRPLETKQQPTDPRWDALKPLLKK